VVVSKSWSHNLLEPATFGVPIIIGPNYSHLRATAFSQHGRMHLNKQELIAAFKDLITDTNYRSEKDIFAALLFK
jgi:3-deoxy-D-manno-octulosonic-acid transferase